MDTTAFFNYQTIAAGAPAGAPAPAPAAAELELLPGATVEDWDAVLTATETLRFRPGDVVLRAGTRDRACYLLLDGQLAPGDAGAVIAAPALVGTAAFADGQPRAVTLTARTHGEIARLSWDAYEALAARDPRLGRAILLALAAGLAARLRAAGGAVDGWTGVLLKGKSGWCSSICPLLPIQRLYGQTPYKLVANSHCTPCVGCTKSCYDFNPKAAFLADLNDPDPYWGGYRKLFAAAFPGLVSGLARPRRKCPTLGSLCDPRMGH